MSRKRSRKYKRKKQVWTIAGISILLMGLLLISIPALRYRLIALFSNKTVPEISLNESRKSLSDYTVFGLDVSQYQYVIVWNKLQEEHDLDFVFIRATAGKDLRDKFFTYNWKSAKNQHLVRGAYHYYRPDENSIEQAENFIRNVNLEAGDFPPVLDIEDYSDIQSLSSLKTGLLKWLQAVESHYGVKPIIYTYYKYYEAHLADDERFDDYPLWLARYSNTNRYYKPGDKWLFWQYTKNGLLSGVEGDVDLNVFVGDLDEMQALRIE